MGTGYTRQDTANNIAPNKIASAADIDNEFDAIVDAFDEATGHTHDGTADEGAPIELTGPNQEYVSTASALYPKTDDTYDLGATNNQWKDLYLDGVAYVDSLQVDTLEDSVDATKKLAFDLSGIGTTTTRTLTVPDATDTLALLAEAQTLTNKTVDSASNTLTVDLSEATVTGTLAEFNTAVSDATLASLTGTETLTNKTLTAPTVTGLDIDDDEFTISDNLDGTKQVAFQVSGVTTATTRTLTVPDESTTIVGTDATQTLTNKTLTSPDINTPDIDGGTVDSTVIGGTTAAAGSFTTLNASGDVAFDTDGFFFDQSTGRLGLSTATPEAVLDVRNTEGAISGTNTLQFGPLGARLQVRSTNDAAAATVAGFEARSLSARPKSVIFTEESDGSESAYFGYEYNGGADQTTLTLKCNTGSIEYDTDSSHIFRYQGADTMRIAAGGNVGINTTSPAKVLSVRQPADGDGIRLNHATRATSTYWDVELSGATNENILFKQFDGVSTESSYALGRDEHVWLVGGSEAMRIVASGNVGIGTSSPDEALEVAGDIKTASSATAGVLHFSQTSDQVKIAGINNGASSRMEFAISGSEAMRIDASGNVGIGTSSPSQILELSDLTGGPTTLQITAGTSGTSNVFFGDSADSSVGFIQYNHPTDAMRFGVNDSEAMRIDSSGNLLVGKTSDATNTEGISLLNSGFLRCERAGSSAGFNRIGSDGEVILFKRQNVDVGSVTVDSSRPSFVGPDSGIQVGGSNAAVYPTNGSGAATDNTYDCGSATARFDDIFATNATIQTSDEREKTGIRDLTTPEVDAAKELAKNVKVFKWISSVEEKGDDARIHTGWIAQTVKSILESHGLDAYDYGLFIHSTGVDDATGQTVDRMGVRSGELHAFVIAGLNARLMALES